MMEAPANDKRGLNLSGFKRQGIQHGVALAFVMLAVLACIGMERLDIHYRFFPFIIAVLASTCVGGWKPGVLAAILGAVTADLLLGRMGALSLPDSPDYAERLVVFLLASGVIIALAEMQLRAQHAAEALVRQLQLQIARQNETETKLLASEERYRSLFDNNLDAVLTLDPSGFFTTANPSALKLCGYTVDELRAMQFTTLCRPEHRAETLRQFQLALEGRPEPFFEIGITSKEGRRLDLLVTGGPIHASGTIAGVFAIAADITERKRSQTRLAAFSKLGQQLSSVTTPLAAGRIIGDVAQELFDWDSFSLNLYSSETGRSEYVLNVETFNGQKIETLPFHSAPGIPPMAKRVMEHGPQLVHLPPGQPAEANPLHGNIWQGTSMMFVPIKVHDKTIGILSVGKQQNEAYDRQDLTTLVALADYCCGALQRIWAREALRHNQNEIQRLNTDLELRVLDRTRQLQVSNAELEAFAYSVSHDLRGPLRSVVGFAEALNDEGAERLTEDGREYLLRILQAGREMDGLIDDLLHLSRLTRIDMKRQPVNLTLLAEGIIGRLRESEPERCVTVTLAPGLIVPADPRLMRIALENLLNNAWKFTRRTPGARIEFGRVDHGEGPAFFVRDNGAGFDMAFAGKLFGAFQRLHSSHEFPGHGIGLATVQRIIHRHGGRTWATGQVDRGASFYFTLPT